MAKVTPRAPARRRPWIRLATALLLVALALLAWFWRPLNLYAATAPSYGARAGCASRYIAGRPLSSCRGDFEPGMRTIMLGEDSAEKSVTATFPLLSRQTATWRKGEGCVLEPWRD
jgi:hypothetical protein